MRESISKVLSSISLATAMVLVVAHGLGAAKPVQAAGPDYTSTWKATRLIQVRSAASSPQFRSEHTPVTATIGVAEWEVTGSTASGTRFREVWSVPGGRTLQGSITGRGLKKWNGEWANGYADVGIGMSGQEKKYLVGFSGTPDMSISTVPVSGAFTKMGQGDDVGSPSFPWASYSGASRCQYQRDEASTVKDYLQPNAPAPYATYCMTATGSYGYSYIARYGHPHLVSMDAGAGTVQPLEWTINGYVCEDAGDARCEAGGSR